MGSITVQVVDGGPVPEAGAQVAVVLVDRADDRGRELVAAAREARARVVLVAGQLDGPDLFSRVVEQLARLQRPAQPGRELAAHGLARREIEVLRLVAEGLDTAEIARRLSYSERTIKNVLHEVTTRLQLRNRPHAVAYAVRQGLI